MKTALHPLVNEMRLQAQYDAVLSVSYVGKVHGQVRQVECECVEGVSGRGHKRGQERQTSQPQAGLPSLARSALWRTPQPFVLNPTLPIAIFLASL